MVRIGREKRNRTEKTERAERELQSREKESLTSVRPAPRRRHDVVGTKVVSLSVYLSMRARDPASHGTRTGLGSAQVSRGKV